MNIEDIKKKLREYNAEVVASRGCCDIVDFSIDVAFLVVENERLLSIIEQQNKFIEKVSAGGSPLKTITEVSKEWIEEASAILAFREG